MENMPHFNFRKHKRPINDKESNWDWELDFILDISQSSLHSKSPAGLSPLKEITDVLHGFKEIDPEATICTLPNGKDFNEDEHDADN